MSNSIKFGLFFLVSAAVFASAQDENNVSRYFDCWMENVGRVAPAELERLGVKTFGEAWLCGCFNMEEKEADEWGEGGIRITKVWDLPPVEVLKCKGKKCAENSEEFNRNLDLCVDHLNSSSFTLKEFAEGGKAHDAIAQKFTDNNKPTPFGTYFTERKDRLDSIQCFFQYHERPDAPRLLDWNRKGVFSISGLPERLLPDAVGRFVDFSDVRCKDKDKWSGFLLNGYLENEMTVDETGKFHGHEIGYGNDPRLPMRQAKEFGKVLYTTEYVHGNKTGISKFYRYSAVDNLFVDPAAAKKMKPYYFLHLEVPYKMGAVHGMVNMFSQKGFLMAEIPYWDNAIHGRVVVHYPFVQDKKAIEKSDKRELKRISKLKGKQRKLAEENFEKMKEAREKIKEKITIDFKKGQLNGPNDLGYSFGNYRDGKLDGKFMTFEVTERCYEWIPVNGIEGTDPTKSNMACLIEKGEKKSWGTFRNGELQGLMECANGIKGKENVDCDHAY